MKFFIGPVFLFLSLSAWSQMEPFLLLEKPGKVKSRIRFYEGDQIKWRYVDEDRINTGIIKTISDSMFTTTKGISVRLEEVGAVAQEKGGGLKGVGQKAFFAIPPMILFSAANNAFNTGRTPLIDEEVWWISGVFLGITGIGYLIPDIKKYKLKSKWRLIPVIH
mgnify:CR=1 FL=1